MSFMAEKLAYFKVPAHVELRDAPLPRNATGKRMKHVLTGGGENTFVEESMGRRETGWSAAHRARVIAAQAAAPMAAVASSERQKEGWRPKGRSRRWKTLEKTGGSVAIPLRSGEGTPADPAAAMMEPTVPEDP